MPEDKYTAYLKRRFSVRHGFITQFSIWNTIKGHKKNRKNNRRFSERKRKQLGIK